MAYELGIRRTLRSEFLEPFWNYRGDENSQQPGVPISFIDFVGTRPDGGKKLLNADSKPITWTDIFKDMGQGPYQTYLNALVARDDDFRFLAGPMIEEMVQKGYAMADPNLIAWWQRLCFQTGVPAVQEALKKPFMMWEGEPKFTGEGEDLPMVKIRHGDYVIHWKKKGCMINFSQEFLMVHPVPVLEAFVVEQTRVLQYQECQHAATTLVNGDVPGAVYSAPVIGVADTAKGIQYSDDLRVWIAGGKIGRRLFTILLGEEASITMEQTEPFYTRALGSALIQLNTVNRPVPSAMDRFLTEIVPEGNQLFVDTNRTMRQRVFLPLHVEGARKPENMTQGVAVATSTTYEIIDDLGRLMLDPTKEFSSNGLPDWWKLGGSRVTPNTTTSWT